MMGYMTADTIEAPITDGNYLLLFGIFLAAGVVIAISLVALRPSPFNWVMMGVYRPIMKPMWSWWAMRTEACAVIYRPRRKGLARVLRGTPFLPAALRPLRHQDRKGLLMDWTDITSSTASGSATIGDQPHSCPQTHLYAGPRHECRPHRDRQGRHRLVRLHDPLRQPRSASSRASSR